jgi:hypothetical protein
MTDVKSGKDQDRGKGAVEQDKPWETGNTSLQGQLGHRDQDPLLKSSDTDSLSQEEIPNTRGREKFLPRKTSPKSLRQIGPSPYATLPFLFPYHPCVANRAQTKDGRVCR